MEEFLDWGGNKLPLTPFMLTFPSLLCTPQQASIMHATNLQCLQQGMLCYDKNCYNWSLKSELFFEDMEITSTFLMRLFHVDTSQINTESSI